MELDKLKLICQNNKYLNMLDVVDEDTTDKFIKVFRNKINEKANEYIKVKKEKLDSCLVLNNKEL